MTSLVNESLTADEKRLAKNKRIKEKGAETRRRRSAMKCATYELKIVENKLTAQQKETLRMVFLEAKWVYNDIISFIKDHKLSQWDAKQKSVTVRLGRNSGITEERSLGNIPAKVKQTLKTRVRNNLSSLKSLKENDHKTGALHYTREVTSVELNQYGVDYRVTSVNTMHVAKLGNVRVRGLAQVPHDAEYSTLTLLNSPDGYYMHVTVFTPVESDKSWADRPLLGVDFGIKTALTLSDGRTFNAMFPVSRRLKRLQRKLSRQVKGSSNYVKTLRKIRKEYQKITRKKDDLANKIVCEIMGSCSLLFMQDENLKGWKSGWFGKQVHASILGRVKALLMKHPRVVVLERWSPTTQYCPECSRLNKTSLDMRVYECECGYSCDRDVHSARNMIILGSVETHIKKSSPLVRGSTVVESNTSALDQEPRVAVRVSVGEEASNNMLCEAALEAQPLKG